MLRLQDELVLDSLDQLRALAHPLRQRIVLLLVEEPRTNQQLGAALGESPARLHFHVRELAGAGLITLVAEQPKGGVIEKYYRAAARSFRLGPALALTSHTDGALQQAVLEAAQQELRHASSYFGDRPPGLRIAQQRATLSPEALDRVHAHLQAIEEEFLAQSAVSADTEGQAIILTYALHALPPAAAPAPTPVAAGGTVSPDDST